MTEGSNILQREANKAIEKLTKKGKRRTETNGDVAEHQVKPHKPFKEMTAQEYEEYCRRAKV